MRAIVVLAELWAASEIVLLTGPLRGAALIYAIVALALFFCCALTYLVTLPPRSARDAPITRQLLPLQLALTLLVVALTGWMLALHAHALAFAPPLWSSINRHLGAALAAVAPGGLGPPLLNFAEYAVLPLVLLALLRVPFAKMGLGGFTRGSAAAAAIWLLLPLFAVAYAILYADTSVALVGRRFLSSFFSSGFSQEFLFRGALFGRLRALMPTQWAAFLQAIAFGLWHFGADVARGHGIVPALALMVPAQAAFAYAMAILVRRSGNLAIPVVLHTTIDTLRSVV
jgi:membrane protease YdiL (CAAX protease family)